MRVGQVGSTLGIQVLGAGTKAYAVTPASSSVNEGTTLTMNVSTEYIADNTTLYWTISHGTTAAADFSSTSGSFVVTGNAGSFNISTVADRTTEGSQTFTVQIRTVSTAGTVVATSSTITVLDTSLTPSYTFTTAPTSINEGTSGTFVITTTEVDDGTTLYWTINNTSTAAADFSVSSGSFTITSSTGTFNIPVLADATTEGAQTFTVSIRTGSISGTVVATSGTITVNDTSLNPTYTFSSTPSSINEGASGTFNVTTTDVTDGTTLYWTINHTTTADADFSPTSGSFTISSNAGSFSVSTVADATTEGAQTFTISIRTGSTAGTVVATSSSVTINDTSLTPVATFTSTPASIDEGSSGTFSVSLANFDSGTLYWTTAHNTTAAADFQSNSGSFTVTGATGSFSVTALADFSTEGAQTFTVQVRTGSTSGTVIGTSASVTINDTSLTPQGQWMLEGTDNFTTAAGYNEATFTVPANVTSISIVCIGGGASSYHQTIVTSGGGMGGGGGGALAYRNNISVTPGQQIVVRAGHGGKYNSTSAQPSAGGKSEFLIGASPQFTAGGGSAPTRSTTSNTQVNGGAGGTVSGSNWTAAYAGGAGGAGYNGNNTSTATVYRGGGGGAGGYAGTGGTGSSYSSGTMTNGTGSNGGGGGGGSKILIGGSVSAPSTTDNFAGRGGGTSPYGVSTTQVRGTNSGSSVAGSGTAGGDGGGLTYGYGGAAIYAADGGGRGVVRIIWGNNRSFPSTNTADV